MKPAVIVPSHHFQVILNRLSHQLIENHKDFKDAVILGLQPKGIYLADRMRQTLQSILGNGSNIQTGSLDITFYRDDFRRREQPLLPSVTNIDFIIENKNVILMDDVFYTGRTARAGLDALLTFGRPKKVEFLTLVERRFSRQLPIQPDYIGFAVDSISSERVSVEWKEIEGEDKVLLYTSKENE